MTRLLLPQYMLFATRSHLRPGIVHIPDIAHSTSKAYQPQTRSESTSVLACQSLYKLLLLQLRFSVSHIFPFPPSKRKTSQETDRWSQKQRNTFLATSSPKSFQSGQFQKVSPL